MEMELNQLIDKIKSEGVQQATSQAQDIIAKAQARAKQVVDDASAQKETILRNAEKQAQALDQNAKAAIKQAARNTLLALRESIIELFDTVLKREVADSLSKDILKQMLLKITASFNKSEAVDIEVLLNDEDKKELEKTFLNELTKQAKAGIVFKASHSINKGFRIGQKGKEYYYDFTDEAIADAFRPHLTSKLIELLEAPNNSSKNAK